MSKDVTLTIDTGNAAFDDGNREAEVARILREAADKIEAGYEDFTLRDYNGNKVGSVTTG